MLSKEENEFLCRVGPGTPMGNLMREYWLPAIRSDELPEPNCPPLRVKLLGEELIGFRTTSGKVGLMQNNCPHRGASLFYGRNEEEGLRCVYHGWKFDCSGSCLDTPGEPAESTFKDRVKAVAYPTHERGGIIWAYMGPREVPPPLPDIEANILTTDPEQISILHRECNWMQGLEGEMDTVHFAFLHAGHENVEDQEPGSYMWYHMRSRRAEFEAMDTDFGCSYGARRPAEADTNYWRIGHVMFPFFALQAAGDMASCKMNAYVPMDDEHTLEWEISVRTDGGPQRNMSSPDQPHRPAAEERARRHLPAADDGLVRPLQPRPEGLQRLRHRPRRAAQDGVLHGHPGHPPAGYGDDGEHGPHLQALAGAPRHDGRDDHSSPQPLDQGGAGAG